MALLDAGVLDLGTPQFYGGQGLARPRFIRDSVRTWSDQLGDDRVLAIALRVGAGAGHMDIDEAVRAWEQAVDAVPDLRGAANWHVAADALAGWGFARVLGPLLARPSILTPRGPAVLPILGHPELTRAEDRFPDPGSQQARGGDPSPQGALSTPEANAHHREGVRGHGRSA